MEQTQHRRCLLMTWTCQIEWMNVFILVGHVNVNTYSNSNTTSVYFSR